MVWGLPIDETTEGYFCKCHWQSSAKCLETCCTDEGIVKNHVWFHDKVPGTTEGVVVETAWGWGCSCPEPEGDPPGGVCPTGTVWK